MDIHRRLQNLKIEWAFFWSAIKQPLANKRKNLTNKKAYSGHLKDKAFKNDHSSLYSSNSLQFLLQQRLRMNQRLEEIQTELDVLNAKKLTRFQERRIDNLHDEAQLISESLEEITQSIGKARTNTSYARRSVIRAK